MYIGGAPVASTNATFTNAWALYVAAGASKFNDVTIGGTLGVTGATALTTLTATSSVFSGTVSIALAGQDRYELGANATAGGFYIYNFTDSRYDLKINDATGAATFISSVTASGSSSSFNASIGDGTYALLSTNTASSNKQWGLITRGTGIAIREAGVIDALSFAAGGAATFSSLAGTGDRLVYANSTGLLGSYTVNNGLSVSSSVLELGGTLTKNTTVTTTGFAMTFSGTATINNSTRYGAYEGLNITAGGTQSNQFGNSGTVSALVVTSATTLTINANSILSAHWGKLYVANGAATNITGGLITSYSAQPTFADAGSMDFVAAYGGIAPRQEAGATAFTGTIAKYAHYYIPDLSTDTNISAQITTMFAIYAKGANDKSYIGGTLNIGTETSNASAAFQVSSTTKGILFPRMTTAQKNAITGVGGLVIYDTDLAKLCVYTTAWQTITSV